MYRSIAIPAIILAASLGTSASLPAQILIDGFLDATTNVVAPGSPSSVITNNIDASVIDRQISVQATGALSIVSTVLDGVLVVDAGGSGTGTANAQLEYLGFVLDLGGNTFFEFTVNTVSGAPIVGLTIQNSSNDVLSGGFQLTPGNTTTSYFLDITQLSGYTPDFGSQLNSVLVFIGGADQAFFVEGASIQFNSVPEPSALTLAGLALLPGVLRRRPKNRSAATRSSFPPVFCPPQV